MHAAGEERHTLTHDGIERSYVLRVPPAVATNGGKAALVLGGDAPTTALDATDLIWDFFRSHPHIAIAP